MKLTFARTHDMTSAHISHWLRAAMPTLLAASVAMLSTAAIAQPEQLVAAGRQVAVAACGTCHGVDGNAQTLNFPKLAGQLSAFTSLQLGNFKSGERPSPVMAAVAMNLTDTQIASVSAYYAALPPMKGVPTTNRSLRARGELIYQAGKAGTPACRNCHGPRGEGVEPVFARIGGQHPDILYASLLPYKGNGTFRNPYALVMKAMVENWTNADLRAVSAYLGTLP